MKLIDKRLKTLALALSLVCQSQAWATDWINIGMSDSAVYGIDRSSVEKDGHKRRVWSKLDYRQPQKTSLGKSYLSSRMLMEIDCQQRLGRSRSLAIYSGANLSGDMLTSEGVIADWQPVPPTSPVFTIMRHVCEI